MKKITKEDILNMPYVDFLAFIKETNRPPGGKDSVRRMASNAFINFKSSVLHSGCNTGYCSFELAHLTKCKIKAIDINKNMVQAANDKLKLEPKFYKNKISFGFGDAYDLKFKDNSFDLVFSGGSTAFMKDPSKVVREYKRVCKPYGFVGDMCMFYRNDPPLDLIEKINSLLKIKIDPWKKGYWVSLYEREGLELYYDYTADMPHDPTNDEVRKYCREMVKEGFKDYPKDIIETATEKFFEYMSLFNENHKYLAYSVLLFRKNETAEQISLFGK